MTTNRLNYNFIAYPRVLLKILDRDELIMLLHIMSFPQASGCFYGTKKWLDILEIGSTPFERAKQKLLFLNLITITEGDNGRENRNPSNIYKFNYDIESWRITREMANDLNKVAANLKINKMSHLR